MLPESHLYTFIDEPREFAAYFLEGQKLIHDLALIHQLHRGGFAYFRDVVLSLQPMIALIKGGEQLGFYIDSEEPYFRLKIETGHHGQTRSMLLPDSLDEFPESMTGLVRVHKLFPNNRPPYQSVLQIEDLPLRDIVNRVLRDSYQVNSAIMLSQSSDQSLLLHQLPPLKGEYDYSLDALRTRRDGIAGSVGEIFDRALLQPAEIVGAFSRIGLRLLASRPVKFHCSCSRDRMLHNLRPIYLSDSTNLFDPDQHEISVICEYCKTDYTIARVDLDRSANPQN